MEGNLQEAKLELIQWLAAIDDPRIIEQIQAIREHEKEDWWGFYEIYWYWREVRGDKDWKLDTYDE